MPHAPYPRTPYPRTGVAVGDSLRAGSLCDPGQQRCAAVCVRRDGAGGEPGRERVQRSGGGDVCIQGGAVHAALAADPGADGELAGGELAGVHADHDGQVRET